MPKFQITIGQTTEEYLTVEVTADTAEAAEAHVQQLIDATTEDQEKQYLALIADKSWELGETHDERVASVEPVSDN